MNNDINLPSASSTASSTPASQQGTAQNIDIEQLADKVYRLMQEDVRLTRARGGTSGIARIRK